MNTEAAEMEVPVTCETCGHTFDLSDPGSYHYFPFTYFCPNCGDTYTQRNEKD